MEGCRSSACRCRAARAAARAAAVGAAAAAATVATVASKDRRSGRHTSSKYDTRHRTKRRCWNSRMPCSPHPTHSLLRYWARLCTSWYTTAGCWTGSTPTCLLPQHRCLPSTPRCHLQL
eukprot:scaffold85756_cov55-Phaeocystis_antarctica.AAC.2